MACGEKEIAERVAEYKQKEHIALEKLVEAGKMTEHHVKGCETLFARFLAQKLSVGVELDWDQIAPLPTEDVLDLRVIDEAKYDPKTVVAALNKLVVLKLNGGVGTSMGCAYPKSCIEVKDGMTFLHVILKQVSSINEKYGTSIPLVLMNSDRTDIMTKEVIEKAKNDLSITNVEVFHFKQPVYPRANPETLLPMDDVSVDNPEFWYPPGHASVLTSFKESGLAEKFAAAGKEWVFVSNSDNLGAMPDGCILNTIIEHREKKTAKNGGKYSFFMEATPKTELDVKGGTPVLYKGSPFLLEASQVPKGKEEDAFNIKKFTLFNTANLWINLNDWVTKEDFDLPIIFNPKTIQIDGVSHKVVQLEMAVGAALSYFNSMIMCVSRNRFIPVKLTCDLLRLQSDLYKFHDNGLVEPQVEKQPVVILSKEFASVEEYKKRVLGQVSLIKATEVQLIGDITLKGHVTFVGKMRYEGTGDAPVTISDDKDKK